MTIRTQTAQDEQTARHYGFAAGLTAGACIGAGLMMWLAPGAVLEVRKRMRASAKSLSDRTSDVRDEVVGTVARGAHEVAVGAKAVEQFVAAAAKHSR